MKALVYEGPGRKSLPDSAGGHSQHADAAKTVRSGKMDPSKRVTHRFKLDQIPDVYETFGRAATTYALKVIIETK